MYEVLHMLSLSLGISWASGINLYATAAMLGLLGTTGNLDLPQQLAFLTEPKIITFAVVMYCIQFFVDKIPILDTVWDAFHSFIRIPMGAILTSHSAGEAGLALSWLAFFVGGVLAGIVHATKASVRILVNTSPEPYSNWFVSFAEDIAVIAGLWAAIHYPILFLVLIAIFFATLARILPFLWGRIRGEFVDLRLNKKHFP